MATSVIEIVATSGCALQNVDIKVANKRNILFIISLSLNVVRICSQILTTYIDECTAFCYHRRLVRSLSWLYFISK